MRKTIAISIAFLMVCAAFLTLGTFAIAMNPLDGEDAYEDTDGDGLVNFLEFEHGTDPMNWDTDLDSLPDGWRPLPCTQARGREAHKEQGASGPGRASGSDGPGVHR